MSGQFESTADTSQLISSEETTSRNGIFGQSTFSQMSDHPIEQADWFNVNSKLRQFGYSPVILTHINKLNSTASGYIILDEMNSHSLRNTVENLLDDCDRKQDLLQELVASSNRLQFDIDLMRQKNDEQIKENLALKASLQTEVVKCQELTRRRDLELQSHSAEVQKLVNANSNLQTKIKELENARILIPSDRPKSPRIQEMKDERPQESQYRIKTEKSAKKERKSSRILGKSNVALNEYDKKLSEMHEELEQLRLQVLGDKEMEWKDKKALLKAKDQDQHRSKRDDVGCSSDESDEANQEEIAATDESQLMHLCDSRSLASTLSSGISDAGFLYKRLKTTERKFKEAKKFIKELSEENAKLQAELNKRPKLKEWKKALVRNKQMENLLLQNNISTSLEASPEQNIKKCTHVDDIDFFPIDVCRLHLKEICKRIDVTNLNDIPRKLDALEDSFQESYKMEKILRHLLRTVKSHEKDAEDDASVCSSLARKGEASAETQWKCLVPTIKIWRDELKQLKSLAEYVKDLSELLLPWKQKDLKKSNKVIISSHVTVDVIKKMLNELSYECKTGPIKHRRGTPTREDLQIVVEHFMKLFDVEDVSGTFARMNDIYVKNSEMLNVLHTLSDLLGLEKNANAASIVNAVGTLAKAKHLLHIQDLDTVIKRLDQYDDFYLAFQSVISNLMDILGVDSVDEIVPSVRALVRFP